MSGPTTTTTNNQQQSSNQAQNNTSLATGQSTINPNMPSWLSSFYQNQPGQMNSLLSQLSGLGSKPLYGQQQQANFQQQLGQQYGQANQNLQSQLARSGALNSSRAGEMGTGLALGQAGQMGNYLSQTPLLNAQFQQGVLGQQGNTLSNAMNYRPPVIGQTQNSSQAMQSLMDALSNSQMSGTQTQQTSGGLMQSLLGGLMGAGMSALTGGLSGMLGGGGGGSPNLSTMMQNPASGIQAPPMALNTPPPQFSAGNPYGVNMGLNNVGSLFYPGY